MTFLRRQLLEYRIQIQMQVEATGSVLLLVHVENLLVEGSTFHKQVQNTRSGS